MVTQAPSFAGPVASTDRPFLHRVDPHGRILRKLRISLTEACNFRCVYCMDPDARNPAEDDLLPASEIRRIAGILVDGGIEAIRLTGGEPTLRRDFAAIVDGLADLEIEKGITTNGQLLSFHAERLASAGFLSANVSLDSLDPDNFRRIARGGDLDRVLEGIQASRRAGIRVKLNCVVQRGRNDREIEAFHDFSARTGIEVRFLELMRIGPARADHDRTRVHSDEIRARLLDHAGALLPAAAASDSTVRRWRTPAGATIGIMESESRPFCGSCSRLRLSSRGVLHPCLFREDGVSLAGASGSQIEDRIRSVAHLKPVDRIDETPRTMNRIGG